MSNFEVKTYHKAILFGYILVPTLYFGFDPLLEVISDNSVHQIYDPLSREPVVVNQIWQIVFNLRVALCQFQDFVDAQRFVLRNEQIVNFVTFYD